MSRTETIRGTMHVVEKEPNETTEGVCERIVRNQIKEFTDLVSFRCSSYEECMRDFVGGYLVYHGEVYDLTDWKDLAYGDIFEATENADGSISYFVQFYNGGCGLEEAIGYALDNLEKS